MVNTSSSSDAAKQKRLNIFLLTINPGFGVNTAHFVHLLSEGNFHTDQ